MKDYEKAYEDFWKVLVENEDGSIDMDKLKRELHDFLRVMEEVPKVYDHITGGHLSKILYKADDVIRAADDHYQSRYKEEFGPHSQYDFVNEDRVFVENSDGTTDYFMLLYEEETAMWVLIPYSDKTFSTPKKDSEGKVTAEPLHAFGYDLLERMEDHDFDDLP